MVIRLGHGRDIGRMQTGGLERPLMEGHGGLFVRRAGDGNRLDLQRVPLLGERRQGFGVLLGHALRHDPSRIATRRQRLLEV